MLNWKDYLNFSNSLIKIIIKFSICLVFLLYPLKCQIKTDTLNIVKKDSVYIMKKSPWGAVLRSAIVPGWGQFYNESYWKIPVIWGVFGYYAYLWNKNNDLYKKNKDNPRINSTAYLDQRDSVTIWFALAYFLNLVDAYVDAHLFDFDVSEHPYTKSPQLNIRFNLK